MELNKETILLQSEFRKFAKEIIAPKVDEIEKKAEVPKDFIKKLTDMGMLGALVPESCGGAALDTLGTVVALEEISKACPSTALILAVHNVCFAYPVVLFGTDEQKKKYLPKACGGEIVGGFAEVATNELITNAGDASSMMTISGKNPLLLNGELNGPFLAVVPTADKTSVNAVIIDIAPSVASGGITITKNNSVIGMKAAGIASIAFNNLRVEKNSLLGNEAGGTAVLAEITNLSRIFFSAIALGIAQAALDNAAKYSKERVQFGEPIAHFGMVREMLSDMATRIETMRLLIYDAALCRDGKKEFHKTAAMAHLVASHDVADITTSAIQVYGGYGYMKDYPVERYFRDAQVIRVLCATSMADKELIAAKII